MKTLCSFFGAAALFFLSAPHASAQINDNCSGAAPIFDVENFCSPYAAGNTFFATASPVPKPSCANNVLRDVWFSFTAVATDVTIVINGGSSNPGGSLGSPTVALYSGTCNQLTELGCAHDFFQAGITELHTGGLTPGETYYIRVDGSFPGTFQYCIRSYFPAGDLSGDCPTALTLCDRTSFNAAAVSGAGSDPNELDDAFCFQGLASESNSSWFVWTAATDGLLEFTLTPNNPDDDLDFVVYRLPNGPADCSDKIVERCMAAGDFFTPSDCMGPTGLSSSATDLSQPPGCLPGDDNFLAALSMKAGTTYALVVNNFTSSGNGFQLDWSGTGEFKGPEVGFTDDEPDGRICRGETIVFTDTTLFPGGALAGWSWNFGKDAVPGNATSQGPHTVQYATAGMKTVVLTVETADGCQVTMTRTITVEPCCALSASVDAQPGCPPAATGATATASTQNALAPLAYTWSNGGADTAAIAGLPTGTYTVTVSDANGCSATAAFSVDVALVGYTVPNDTLILAGQEVTLTATSTDPGATVEWNDGSQLLTGASITASPADTTTYTVTITAGDCVLTDSVLVQVLRERFNMPNAFTPNGDDANDAFYPASAGVDILEFRVWSRWGKLVHDDPTKGWDGTVNGAEAPADIYVYHVRYRRIDGQELLQKGDVALLR